ncbi:hypothetical protein SLS55_003010 [Diplodia seriata]|uniref:Heterokaryon incompatibility domain-containing protein n=1 Tax=Diplodia seriata TaxID=420778 RepID=A0ABR3CLS0_9PEZI
MDHLPTFEPGTGPYPTVPYLPNDNDVYDGDTFEGYPERQGWSSSLLFAGDFRQGRELSDAAAFLQKWLYFGLLNELSLVGSIFGRKIFRNEKFVQDEESKKEKEKREKGGEEKPDGEGGSGSNGGKIVSTKKLEKLLKKRVDDLKLVMDSQREKHMLRLEKALATACALSEALAVLRRSKSDECPLPFEAILSIKVLGRAVDDALKDEALAEEARDWGLRPIAVERMREDGWCPREVSLVNTFLSETSMFCASYMKRDSTKEQGVEHTQCNEFECLANQIDDNAYTTRHREEDCKCDFYHVDEEKLQQMIRDERIPYVEMKPVKLEDETKTLHVELKSHKDSLIEYHRGIVIFSHVWSDGLGNPKQNALPMCQIQHFYNILRDAPWWDVQTKESKEKRAQGRYKDRQIKQSGVGIPKSIRAPIREFFGRPVRIWLDTLCVPVEGETKKMAITKLKRYYANADMTVVLDAELLRIEHKRCTEGEILLRIALSGWMRRCWTYQEAIIASGRLRVLFADGYYDLPDVVGFMRQLNSIAPYLLSQKQQQRSQDLQEAVRYSATAAATAVDIYRKGLWLLDPAKALTNALSGGRTVVNLGPYVDKAKKIFNPADPFVFLPAPARLAADTKSFFAGITAMWAEPPSSADGDESLLLQNRVHRMVAAWESLRYRTTSHARDRLVNFVFACAKSQRDFRVLERVLDAPAERRFRAWLLEQPALPAGLLFVRGPKMGPERGWRWAPADVHVASVEDDAVARSCVLGGGTGVGEEEKKRARFVTPGLLPVSKDLFAAAKEGVAAYFEDGKADGDAAGAGARAAAAPALRMTAEGSLKFKKPGFLVRERLRPVDVQFYLRDEVAEKSYLVVLDWSSTPPGVTAECLADVGPSIALVLRREPENGTIETAALLVDVAGAEVVCTGLFVCRALVKKGKRPSSNTETTLVTGMRAPDDQDWIVS